MLSLFQKFFNPSDRIQKIKSDLFAETCSICLERPLLMEQFWKTSDAKQKKHFSLLVHN